MLDLRDIPLLGHEYMNIATIVRLVRTEVLCTRRSARQDSQNQGSDMPSVAPIRPADLNRPTAPRTDLPRYAPWSPIWRDRWGFCPFHGPPTVPLTSGCPPLATSSGYDTAAHSSAATLAGSFRILLGRTTLENGHGSRCWIPQTTRAQWPSIGSPSTTHTKCRSAPRDYQRRVARAPRGARAASVS